MTASASTKRRVKTVGRWQVRLMQGHLDVQPIAEEITAAILAGRPDKRINLSVMENYGERMW